jgi:hypothetical protein
VRRGQNKTRLITQTKALDNTQTKIKNRHKNKQTKTSANLPKKDTKRDTSMRDLYGQLETLVQDHIENQLKNRHNGQLPYKRFSRRPSNTDLHILERHKRRIFGLIQTHVERYIGLSIYTKNDHSTTLMCNHLRYNTPGGAESSEGRSDNVPHPTFPAHPPRSQLSQIQKLHQPQATPQVKKMPQTQLEAVRDVQADILSTLKEASYFTNDTTRAHINSLHIDSFNKLKYRVKKMKVRCERAIRACTDGQTLAPRHRKFEYYYRLFGDLLEITHLELDRVLEISEYMEQQEDIIKFRSEHYNEYGYQSIQNRQATPLIQCNQNLQGSSCVNSPSSPEYSKASSSEDTEDSETDDSDTSSDTTKQYAWSVSSGSSDEETEE